MDEKSKDETGEKLKKDVIPGYKSIDDFTKDGFKILIESAKDSNGLPSEKDWNFYKTNDKFSSLMNEEGIKILGLINTIMRKYGKDENIKHRSIEEKIDLIIDTNDSILENVANHIDEINGIRKVTNEPIEIQMVTAQLPIINGSWNKINKATFSVNSPSNNEANCSKKDVKSIHLLTAKNITRPQKFFKDKIDNSNKYPWEPRITEKPNSIKPLALYLEETIFGESFCHPYELELEKFSPTEDQLQLETPVIPKPVRKTPLYEIKTQEELNDLLNELHKHKEFAVDVEHHSYRSFMGITCLMQISTCDADYLIDTLALRDKLHVLNEVFTKPTIVKVFHGADSDVQWLQRDLSIYVVNLFDTHQAAKQLGYTRLSLSYLLSKFCNFLPDKKFQLADWRIRPLPEQLKSYAREDTHYLLYVYHCLKKELFEKSKNNEMFRSVINMSTEICKKRYIKPILNDESHINFYRKCKRMFDNRQMYALKHLYSWRDRIAREEDESTGYVLPNHMLLQISEAIPREMQGILACCNPIPPLIRSNLLELHKIILRAREQPLQKAIMNEENRSRGSTQQLIKINANNPLFCPHDLTVLNEFRDDLPTLLNGSLTNKLNESVQSDLECTKSKISAFNTVNDEIKKKANERKLKFLGPHERYKMVKDYIQAEEKNTIVEDGVSNQHDEDKIAKLHHFETIPATKDDKITISTQDEIEKLQDHVRGQININSQDNEEKSLIEMGGSKKRKRDMFEDIDGRSTKIIKFGKELESTIPHFGVCTRSRKRKHDIDNESTSTNKMDKIDDVRHYDNVPTLYKQKKGKKQKGKRKEKLDKEKVANEKKVENKETMTNNEKGNISNKRNKRAKWKNRNPNDNNSKPFDYSTVDFKQFQGGAKGIQTNKKKVKTNYRPKGKNKNNNKSQNRSSTFSQDPKTK